MLSLPIEAALWVATSANKKTGDVPTLWIGRTRQESLGSCRGCPLLEDCYAQRGQVAIAHHSVFKAAKRDRKRYTLTEALLSSNRRAKMARVSALGDPSRLPAKYMLASFEAIRAFGLAVVGYTHFFEGAPHLRGHLMASCDTDKRAVKALSEGWRVALTVPVDFKGHDKQGRFKLSDGSPAQICPAILNGDVTCNECLACDASVPGPVVVFPMHGPKQQGVLRKAKRIQTAKARALLERISKGGA